MESKQTPKYLNAPQKFKYDYMIIQYAGYFKKLPNEIAQNITELDWYRWYCNLVVIKTNEHYQMNIK